MLHRLIASIVLCTALLAGGHSGRVAAQTVVDVRPAASGLAPPSAQQMGERIQMLPIDTLFYVENEGLARIHVNLSGHRFKMVTDPAEVERSVNAFLMPEYGEITVNVAALIRPDDTNFVEFVSQGPAGTEAQVVLSPVPVIGQTVAFAIESLEPLPAQFRLMHSYPNPFRQRTTLAYAIPDTRINGVDVRLAVYDALGRRVTVLVDGRRFPGRYTATWTPPPGAASGTYFARLVAGGSQATIPMVLIR